jgi:hypothetical protein
MSLSLDVLPAADVAEVRCATCTSPDRKQIEELITAGYPLKRIVAYLRAQGIETATPQAMGNHKRNHMLAPDDPAGITAMALARGGRDLKNGKIKLNASSLAAFVKLQREQDLDGRAKASEELAAMAVNHMLTVVRRYLSPDEFFAFKDEAWPGLMELIEKIQDPGDVASTAPEGASSSAAGDPDSGSESASAPEGAPSTAAGPAPADGASWSAPEGAAGEAVSGKIVPGGAGTRVPQDGSQSAPWLPGATSSAPEGARLTAGVVPAGGGEAAAPGSASSSAAGRVVPPWLREAVSGE